MTQSWDQFPAAAPTPQHPVIDRTPPPQTADERLSGHLRNIEAQQRIDEFNRTHAPPGTNATPADQRQAQALIEGRIPWPTGRASTDPHWQQIIAIASEMDPNLDAATQAQRRAGILAFTGNSPGARLVGSVNRVANHLNDLNTLSERLAGPNVLGNRQLSSAAAYIGQSQEGPDLAAYETAVQQVAGELEKIATNSPGTLAGRQDTISHLSPNQSLEARRAAIREVVSLIHGAIEPLQNQYNSSFQEGTSRPPVPWITGRSQQIYQSLGGVDMSLPGAPGEAGGTIAGPATPPIVGGPPAPPTPPGSAPGGGHMDATTVNMASAGADDMSLNTGATQNVPDPALAGINEHVQGMLHAGTPDAEIRQYIQDRGVPIEQIPGFNDVLAWRQAHPGYQGNYRVELDKHLVPQSLTRQVMTNIGDSSAGAYTVAAGNMVTGQQLANIVGATGGDAELAQRGIGEIRNRHPISSVAGDISGAALAYGGINAGARAGLNATERIAPSIYARLPAWVRAGSTAGEAEAAAAPFSQQAASNAALAPTATFAPRAIASDAGIGAYESPGNRLEGAGVSAATGGAFRGTVNTAARAVSPTGGDLAPAYEEGVVPTLGQRAGGIFNRTEQAFQSVPVLGGIQRSARTAAQDQWQLGGFNRALRNLPDEPQLPAGTAPGTEPHAFAQDAFDKAYDRVHQRIRVVDDPQLQQDLTDIRQGATMLSDQSLSHFNRIIDNSVLRRLENSGGELSGEDLQQTLSEVRRTARSLRSNPTGDRELASQLDDLAGAIHDNATRHSPAEAISTLGNINRGYGMLVRIENAANRAGAGEPGEYTAKGLLNAERQQGGLRGRQFLAGDGLMTNYARAGMKLGSTVPDSGTFERAATVGSMAGAANFVSPYFAAPWAVDTLATLPGARNAVNFALRPNNAAIRPFTDVLRAQLQARAGIGSTIGLPAVVAAYQGQP